MFLDGARTQLQLSKDDGRTRILRGCFMFHPELIIGKSWTPHSLDTSKKVPMRVKNYLPMGAFPMHGYAPRSSVVDDEDATLQSAELSNTILKAIGHLVGCSHD